MDISQQIKNRIYRLSLRILGTKEDAEDITQEVLIKIWTKRTHFKRIQSNEALALKITKDLCLNLLKHRKVKQKKQKILLLNKTRNTSNANDYENKDLMVITKQLIQQLPNMQRIVIQLRDVEGFEFEEIQKILDSDINAIRMNLSRARKKVGDELRKSIREFLANSPDILADFEAERRKNQKLKKYFLKSIGQEPYE